MRLTTLSKTYNITPRPFVWLTVGVLGAAAAVVGACSGAPADVGLSTHCGPGTMLVGTICAPIEDATTGGDARASGDDSGRDGGASGQGDADANAEVPPNRCPSAHGPKMVELPDPGGGTYCIDSTEVTNAQYAAFYADANGPWPKPDGGPRECEWPNGQIDSPPAGREECSYDLAARANNPINCIDWCSAYKYCAWAGKRLCGRFRGGALPQELSNDPGESQWYRACSEARKNKWTYGNAVTEKCNDVRYDAGTWLQGHTAPVGAFSECHSADVPYAYLRDLSGNAHEWEDACDGGLCNIRGGGFNSSGEYTTCSNEDWFAAIAPRTQRMVAGSPAVGFRCCAD
jgi:sulfatase modifying factor 1